jgi:hypothetical protein
MLGSGNPTPYDTPLFLLLVVLALLLIVGAVTATSWSPGTATIVRRAAAILAIGATVVVFRITPTTNGIIGAARVLFIWPALAVTVIAYAVWSWRAGRL